MSDTDRERGLYHKYITVDGKVHRLKDPTGKHENCEYFVLDPKHDKFAVAGMQAYANACREEYPELAADLDKWVEQAIQDSNRT